MKPQEFDPKRHVSFKATKNEEFNVKIPLHFALQTLLTKLECDYSDWLSDCSVWSR